MRSSTFGSHCSEFIVVGANSRKNRPGKTAGLMYFGQTIKNARSATRCEQFMIDILRDSFTTK